MSDGHGGTASVDITINIVGTNDRPTLTLTPTSDTVVSDPGYDKDHTEVAKDLTVTGTFEGADPDSNPTLEYGVSTSAGNRDTAFDANGNNPGMGGGHHSATGTYGSLTIDPSTGEYIYTLDTAKGGAADKLGLNADGTPQTGTDTFTIYVRDEHGAWSEQTVTITVNGSNDAPVIAKTENTLTVTESGFKADNTAVDTTHDVSKGSVNATDVVVAVDVTGSMAVKDAQYGSAEQSSRLDVAKQAVKDVTALYPNSSFAALRFGASGTLDVPLTPDSNAIDNWAVYTRARGDFRFGRFDVGCPYRPAAADLQVHS